jgi:hypothetical protein
MRTLALAILVAASGGCSNDPVMGGEGDPPDGGGGGGADSRPQPTNGFRIETPEITLAAGDERTYCYYTSLPNEQAVGIKRWSSTMTPGSHHLIVYFTSSANQPDGTVTEDCGLGASIGNVPIWAYASSQPEGGFEMPEGVGMNADARQHLFVQLHYLNTGESDLSVHATIDGETFPDGETFTPARAYITYNTEINVGVGENGEAGGSCDVPSTAKFFTLSTHAHRFNTRATVSDGSTMLVDTTDWEHPDVAKWDAEPFYTFTNKLTYHCEYYNFSDRPVEEGDSARTNEMCMAVGYFFPADAPIFCLNSYVVPF